ncbi:hypothetical protein [Levilactobacillus zymae]|uniref:Uncharacterized protein n=1 Tax=Levilactobacillus zymae TaxID=267363 RepID=A0A1Y6JYY5_9LACO|nr:hypothetical protein [Levilactobacillus zymae]KRL09565.1 hypothetical protein FD38_GL002161 [Levilactobacillus zymae DSM 19395]QFR62269.1 hypothetical protein LZ395_12285 [Levilactobacillus zymae]GEO71935.1 hypothetical protein LZY01_11030 [Levilactobacillus zymae]SMS15137.1 hypothetical protein LZ3411_2087 [Levilactobacillus zymae]
MHIFRDENGIRLVVSHQLGHFAARFADYAPEQEFINYELSKDKRGRYHLVIEKTNLTELAAPVFQKELVFGDLGDTLTPLAGVTLMLI